ncbi:MAG: hypothetical protein IH936_08600 [Acidobacteria bacterium]|nr:hypothetical protein [Acidobacteriota bacterium]
MGIERPPDDRNWAVTWADSGRAQLAEALSATPAQRLAWLEEAIEFAYRASHAGSPQTGHGKIMQPGSPED